MEAARREVVGPVYSEEPEFKVGDPVWLCVEGAMDARGWWRGEVTSVAPGKGDEFKYRAKIMDPRVRANHDWNVSSRFGQEPMKYEVFPWTRATESLIQRLQYEVEWRNKEKHTHKVREVALLDALTHVTARGLTQEQIVNAVLDKPSLDGSKPQ